MREDWEEIWKEARLSLENSGTYVSREKDTPETVGKAFNEIQFKIINFFEELGDVDIFVASSSKVITSIEIGLEQEGGYKEIGSSFDISEPQERIETYEYDDMGNNYCIKVTGRNKCGDCNEYKMKDEAKDEYYCPICD